MIEKLMLKAMQSMICNQLSFTRESTAVVRTHIIFVRNGMISNMHLSPLSLFLPTNDAGHYYSYVRPDVQTNDWYRFDDEFVTRVGYTDVIADAFGGSFSARRKRSRSDTFESIDTQEEQRRGLLQRILSLFGLFRRMTMIRSRIPDRRSGFGYGGRTSNAYMLQYVRRLDVPKLYNL